ncbi:c-1-tetrahydrofolate synthase cytoplasmic [Anaeramoeba ignava]|uniref:C-1-tetrahydrofolate synthase cytoplasmic n=1 Tax=Anaeramoeba ignava TaxID=1746090 RepID=A0A9Q0LLG5_ANAIG|nr:c-1-tetrahydrofolate synthase cytoplasmic [Anaeramoeba ignava]|eukprot:Anaeramoba_ignava/c20218_g2_i1.p1 GENE.c20218_g2_i1~~c20218_g2_i1.p1  ORF type:complete len:297 (-),score=97.26 c20218_g2_i1:2-892(-)
MATVFNGRKIAQNIKQEVKNELSQLKEVTHKTPGLAAILVGERKDSQIYFRMKKKSAEEVGIKIFETIFPENTTQEEIEKVIQKYNQDTNIHGILVELPLPIHINQAQILDMIDEKKDVDGFTPQSVGKLAMKDRDPLFSGCTPLGCIELLDRYNIPIESKHAVVVGRSNLVGLPTSMLLLNRNATVTIVHSKTTDIHEKISQADILVAAIQKPEFIQGSWLKKGAVVLDVGINQIPDKTQKSGFRIVGDVDFENAKVSLGEDGFITPVPGGLGPMTIAMLMRNVLKSFKMHELKN